MADAKTSEKPKAALGEALEWLKGKSREDLDIAEQGGRLFFKDKLVAFGSKGKLEQVPVRVRVPRTPEILRARAEANKLFTKAGLDREKDAAQFEDLDTFSILALAIRDDAEGFPQHRELTALIEEYETKSLFDIWDRLQEYQRILDPKLTELDEEEVVKLACAIAVKRNLSPLVALPPHERDSFIVSMAVLLMTSPTSS